MKYVYLAILVLLILVSLAAGAAKVMQTPQEVEFFQQVGMGTGVLITFGIIQILGGLLAILPKFRKLGLTIMAAMFLLSAVQIFMTGNAVFGSLSLIPAALAIFLFRRP